MKKTQYAAFVVKDKEEYKISAVLKHIMKGDSITNKLFVPNQIGYFMDVDQDSMKIENGRTEIITEGSDTPIFIEQGNSKVNIDVIDKSGNRISVSFEYKELATTLLTKKKVKELFNIS